MLPAYTYPKICSELTNKVRWSENVKMAGLLFARPTSILAASEIVPHLDYFHHRSANHVHFFCGGYGAYWPPGKFKDQNAVILMNGTDWFFSAEQFNQLRSEIERKIAWRYSGATDLILFNVLATQSKRMELDFSSAWSFQLERMKDDGVISGVEMFFEEIFRFAESYRGNYAVRAFVDPPDLEYVRYAPTNIGTLSQRMGDCWRRNDYGGVLHAVASIFETMAKYVVQRPTVENQTLGGFISLYRKHSALPAQDLDRIEKIYQRRNTTPLAGHGGTKAPNISREEAQSLIKFTSECIRYECKKHALFVGV